MFVVYTGLNRRRSCCVLLVGFIDNLKVVNTGHGSHGNNLQSSYCGVTRAEGAVVSFLTVST